MNNLVVKPIIVYAPNDTKAATEYLEAHNEDELIGWITLLQGQ
jgi:hypothetical protein